MPSRSDPSSTGSIYGLHAGDGEIRYVGQTVRSMGQRLSSHLHEAMKGSDFPVHRWIRKHGRAGICFTVLEECPPELLDDREREWIAHYRSCAPGRLLNVRDGGAAMTERDRSRRSLEASGERNPFHGQRHTAENLAKISRASSEAMKSPARRALSSMPGQRNPSAFLTEEQVRDIFTEYATQEVRQVDLARRYGVTQVTVSSIILGKTWTHLELVDRQQRFHDTLVS